MIDNGSNNIKTAVGDEILYLNFFNSDILFYFPDNLEDQDYYPISA